MGADEWWVVSIRPRVVVPAYLTERGRGGHPTAASAAASAAATLSASTVTFSGSTRALQIVLPAGLSSTTISPTLRTVPIQARLHSQPSTQAPRSPRGRPIGNTDQVTARTACSATSNHRSPGVADRRAKNDVRHDQVEGGADVNPVRLFAHGLIPGAQDQSSVVFDALPKIIRGHSPTELAEILELANEDRWHPRTRLPNLVGGSLDEPLNGDHWLDEI